MALNSEDTTKLEAARPTATARVQRFAKTLPPALLAEDQRIADELSRSNASLREKLARVYRLIDAFSDAAQPYTPCQSGCGACCRMNVAITSLEAERLGEFSGRTPATLAGPVAHTPSDFAGAPCPPLVGEKCSVYDGSPLGMPVASHIRCRQLLVPA